MVYSTRRFVVCLSVCHFVLVFFSPFSIAITSLGKRELILVLFVRLFCLCLFRFVGFLFLLGSGKGCGLWLWYSLDFSLTFFAICLISPQHPFLYNSHFCVISVLTVVDKSFPWLKHCEDKFGFVPVFIFFVQMLRIFTIHLYFSCCWVRHSPR